MKSGAKVRFFLLTVTILLLAWYWIGSVAYRAEHALDATSLASQDIADFRAIKPKVPAYEAYRQNFESLLETVAKVRKERSAANGGQGRKGDVTDMDGMGGKRW